MLFVYKFLFICQLLIVNSIFLFFVAVNNSDYLGVNLIVPEVPYSGYVTIKNTIIGIPEEIIIKRIVVDSSLPIPQDEYFKIYKNNQDLQYLEGYRENTEKIINTLAYSSTAEFVIMKNMYASFAGSYAMHNFSFLDVEPQQVLKSIRCHQNGWVIGHYPSVIALGHSSLFCFSHWYYDVLSPLVLIPEEIINNSYIIAYQHRNMVLDTLIPLGIKEEKIIFISKRKWVFANRLIAAINPTPHISHYNKATLILSQKLRSYYQLDKIIPTKYCFSNRKKTRKISNLEEIFEVTVKTFPQYTFLIVPDYKELKGYGKLWAESKFMFMGTGSNFIKNVFMKEKSVLVVGLANIFDHSIALSAKSHSIFVLFFEIVGMIHFGGDEHPCDVSLALRVISIGLYCAEHGHWRSGENFTYISQ